MLPRDKTFLLKGSIVWGAGSPGRGRISNNPSTRLEAKAGLVVTSWDILASFENDTRHVEAGNSRVLGDEETLAAHESVGWVERDRLDGDEEFVWSWLWGGARLDLERLAFAFEDGSEMGRHCDVMMRVEKRCGVSCEYMFKE